MWLWYITGGSVPNPAESIIATAHNQATIPTNENAVKSGSGENVKSFHNHPNLLKCTAETGSEWAGRVFKHFPVLTSQIRTDSSNEPRRCFVGYISGNTKIHGDSHQRRRDWTEGWSCNKRHSCCGPSGFLGICLKSLSRCLLRIIVLNSVQMKYNLFILQVTICTWTQFPDFQRFVIAGWNQQPTEVNMDINWIHSDSDTGSKIRRLQWYLSELQATSEIPSLCPEIVFSNFPSYAP